MAGSQPSAVTSVVTTYDAVNSNVVCSWTQGATNGFAITGNRVAIRRSDGFTYDSVTPYCTENAGILNAASVSGQKCTFPLSRIQGANWNLPQNTGIWC